MHFFIDHTKLVQQQSEDQYGPDIANPTTKFNITSKFVLTSSAKAFACQDSIMIVQQSSVDSSLVNVILKPIEGLKIPFSSVKYFVYRGLLKSSFITGIVIKPQSDTDKSEFIARFWKDWNNYKKDKNVILPDPTPQSFGYDNSLTDALEIESIYDNSQENIQGLLVKEGEWIGDFSSVQKNGFEVVLETDNVTIDLNYLRADKYQIDVTGLAGLELRAKQELILSFIDPVALFGLHYETGVKTTSNSGTNNKLIKNNKGANLYSAILDKFATKNRVYLDIRSEHGYSYNFYQNYKGPIGDENYGTDLLIGDDNNFNAGVFYQENGWPIKFFESAQTTIANQNKMFIALRTDDNTAPILFSQNKFKESGNYFLSGTQIAGPIWTEPIEFAIPNTAVSGTTKNNVSYYIKLQYFRGEYNVNSPNTILKNENYFDLAFCPIDLPRIADANYLLQQVVNSDLNYVSGLLPGISNKFSHVAANGARWDTNRIVFYSQSIFQFKNPGSSYYFDSIPNWGINMGFNLAGSFNKNSFLAKDVFVAQTNIQEILAPGVYQKIKLLDIANYNGFPNSYGSIICLGITRIELETLINISGFSNRHHRYIYIEEINGSSLTDKDGKSFQKFRLKVQGFDDNGGRLISPPSANIYVYSNSGSLFVSKDFSDQETNQQGLVYQRNYEEAIGYNNVEPSTHQHYEDFFIGKDNGMKIEVDGFIEALGNIANDENAYQRIKALVEDSAKDIWNQAVSSVQANGSANPDDRPLYWARNKMEVALKSHPYFENQFIFSDVTPRSELEIMVKNFEQKSRNYGGVNFNYATQNNLKKVLITGFDPFQLDPVLFGSTAQDTQNPSGIAALELHNTQVNSGGKTGYIQSVIFPVRYPDFDAGVVENLVNQFLVGPTKVDMIISLSLNGSAYFFDLERFSVKSRGGFLDNLKIGSIAYSAYGANYSKYRANVGNGRAFYETTLPTNKIVTNAIANNFNAIGQKVFFDQSYGLSDQLLIVDHPIVKVLNSNAYNTNVPSFNNSTINNNNMKQGSGGDYLSNEIFYRISRARENNGNNVKTGHYHLANPNGSLPSDIIGRNPGIEDIITPSTYTTFSVVEIINEVRNAIKRALDGL